MTVLKPDNAKPQKFLLPGTIFAERYLILEKIGQGAHAEIYKAADQLTNNHLVALKIIKLRKEYYQNQKQNLDMEREAFAKLMFHKNVIGLRDYDSSRRLFYMTIDLVNEGLSLQDCFKPLGNLMTIAELKYYFGQIARGMQAIHDAKIIHRDLKPQNILVDNWEIIKISDFGISKMKVGELDSPHGFEGTPKYTAPEQYWDNSNYYFQSDIYSMGVMLYEYATGVPPYAIFKDFKEDRARYNFILQQHLKEKIVRPKVFNPTIPQSLDNIIVKCLAKDIRRRYQSFADFLKDFEKIDYHTNAKIEVISDSFGNKKINQLVLNNRGARFDRFLKWTSFRNLCFISVFLLMIAMVLPLLFLLT